MLSLFAVALLSATLLPGASELWLARQWCSGASEVLLWLVATSGNTLGSLINVALGRHARRYQDRRWFPASRQGLERAERFYLHIGEASLLLSWLPVVGDPLTVLAGVFRLPWWRALFWLLMAKGGRYLVILLLAKSWLAPLCEAA